MVSDARLHVIVQGLVQGVSFRYFTIRLAEKLNLTGWVRNVGRDKVETVAEGEEDSLKAFLAEIRIGPPSAHVTNIEIKWSKPLYDLKYFQLKYDE